MANTTEKNSITLPEGSLNTSVEKEQRDTDTVGASFSSLMALTNQLQSEGKEITADDEAAYKAAIQRFDGQAKKQSKIRSVVSSLTDMTMSPEAYKAKLGKLTSLITGSKSTLFGKGQSAVVAPASENILGPRA